MNYIIEKSLRLLPDKLYLQLLYFKHFKKLIDFKDPTTFNEKLQWLKLNDRAPLYTTIVDKLAMKDWLANKVGEGYTVPTLGVWDKPEDIEFDRLPNNFVLKWNHDSGSIVICKDKNSFNQEEAIKKLQHGATFNGFWYGREWPYLNVPPKVFAEPYLEDKETKELRDYKLFTFNGEVKLLLIASERQKPGVDTKFDFYNIELNHINMRNQHENAAIPPTPPKSFHLMKELAEKISKNFAHLRVDFYEVDGRVYIGELTLYHGSGFMTFSPNEWYRILGDWIDLSSVKK